MSTAPCDRCDDQASEPLLREVRLVVDDAAVDEQTLCPDCFSDWIARYQEEMAGNMPGQSTDEDPESVGDDIRIAEEEPQTPSVDAESNVLNQAVDAAQEQARSDDRSNGGETPDNGADDDIRELEVESSDTTAEPGDGDIEIDLGVGGTDEDDTGLY